MTHPPARGRDRVTIAARDSRSLSPGELDEVWALTDRYVESERASFERKLREVPEVLLFRNARGELVGVSSVDVYPVRRGGRTEWVIFNANAVVDEAYRRRGILERAGARTFLRLKRRRPLARAWWMFDTFSFKSYLLLPRNFRDFWPRRERETPGEVRALLDELARARYGDAWDAARGVVRRSGKKRLRPHTAPVDEALLADPDVRFYEAANPGHREGDMLVCLCPLTLGNWLYLARASLRRLAARSLRARS
jgi:hypothetical protein